MEHGKEKTHSEDTMLLNRTLCKEGYYSFSTPGNCTAIADGVGGNPGGKEASEFVISKINGNGPLNNVDDAYVINEELLSYASTIPSKEKMATTLTALFFYEENPLRIIHVGNTRLYAIQGEYLKQLTRDHTTVEYLKARGDYEAAENAAKNEITACFGGGTSSTIKQLQIYEFDRDYAGFVITSDGFHDYLDEEALEDFISADSFTEDSFKSLAQKAEEAGSTDDKSIIVIKRRK